MWASIDAYFPNEEDDDPPDQDVTEIAKLRYFPKAVGTVAYFEGLQILKGNATKLIPRLNPLWLRNVFHPKFVRLVMEAASFKKTMGKWISVPIGNREDDNLPPPSILDWRWVKY